MRTGDFGTDSAWVGLFSCAQDRANAKTGDGLYSKRYRTGNHNG